MPEKTKPEREEDEKENKEKPEAGDRQSWSEDQQRRGYYYDDACGYEIYRPEDEEDEGK